MNDDDCDCTYDGNRQIIGPNCLQNIEDAWEKATGTTARIINPVLTNREQA